MGQEQRVLERFACDYPAGTALFHEGDPGDKMYVIRSGKVRISKRMSGVEQTLGLLLPGEFFGEMALLCNRPRSATATVVEAARLLVIDAQTFETMLRTNLEVAVRMIRKLAQRLAVADWRIQTLRAPDSHRKVACFFLGAVEGQDQETAVLKVDPQEIALETGCESAEVQDALERLASAGLVVPDGTGSFRVRDRLALADYLEETQ
jgi:CRP/FNR family cyclic AMP-dependent transcriptional regulator